MAVFNSLDLIKKLLLNGKRDDCIFELVKFVKNPEVDSKELYEAGLIFHELGVLDRAIQCFEHCLKLNPSFTDASIALSVIFNDLGQYDRARDLFESAERVASESNQREKIENLSASHMFAAKHNELGMLYMAYHRYIEAKMEFEKAKKLDVEKPEFKINFAKSLVKLGRLNQAKEALQSCVKEHPKNMIVRINLGLLNFESGDVENARQEWRKALDLEPSNQQVRKFLQMVQ